MPSSHDPAPAPRAPSDPAAGGASPRSTTLVVADERMLDHDTGMGHPERPERLRAILDELDRAPVPGTTRVAPEPAPRAAVERVHPASHVDAVESLRGRRGAFDPDTTVSPGSVPAAWLAAGAAVDATTAVLEGTARNAFALVRPPGHHAEAERAMGFCLFNNLAVAAAHALAQPGCERVLVVDWDVHHGNGTQHLFYDRSDVLVFNTHRFPFYPGTGSLEESGTGGGAGYTVNVPMPGGLGDADYGAAFADVLLPVAEAFGPDLVLVSAGFDAHRDDPLGGMRVSAEGFAALCGAVVDVAERLAGGRVVLVLEGGYDLRALARSVRACADVLTGATPPPLVTAGTGGPIAAGLAAVHGAVQHHRRWTRGSGP